MENIILPERKDYQEFIEQFSKKVKEITPDSCFYLYGSYPEARAEYGRSDIDGGIILNSEFVTDKQKILELSFALKECILETRMFIEGSEKTQFNLLDRGTNKDGRFLSYTASYSEYLNENARIICGPDYLQEIKRMDFKAGELHAASFNLRRMRNNLLLSSFKLSQDESGFRKGVEKAMESLSGLPKKLQYLRNGKIIKERARSVEIVKKQFRGLDTSTLEKITTLFHKPPKLYRFLQRTDNALKFFQEVLTSYEQLIEAYVKNYPEVSCREVRG